MVKELFSGLTKQTSTTIPGGKYDNICDGNGDMYVEVDLSCPACIKCDSVDGYVCSYFGSSAVVTVGSAQSESPFMASWREYYDFRIRIGYG